VQTKSRAPYDGDWYAWDVIRRLDATDETSIALSPVGGVVDGNHIWSDASPLRKGFEYGHMWSNTDRRLLPSVVGTAAVWRDWRYYPQYYFVSDTLFAAIEAAKITGIQARMKFFFA